MTDRNPFIMHKTKHHYIIGFILSAFIVIPGIIFSQDGDYTKVVIRFIDRVKKDSIEKIAENTNYPLSRETPLPGIKSKKDFECRYHEIFDDSLINLIINSDVKKDWSAVGYRGIMFLNGEVWLDYDGNLQAVNYESKIEQQKRDSLVLNDKSKLYPSLRNFKAPVLYWQTDKFRIRVDDLGNYNYRYASWPVSKKQSDKPDLVLINGKVEFDGSGGNHNYIFKNDVYTYICQVTVIGEEDEAPDVFIILKNGKEILNETAVKLSGE
jgi:hypothetical protein